MVVDRIGQQFAGYRLIRLLGQGGFAEVYLGEHIHLGFQVAIKVLHTRLIAREQEQFLQEARVIAALNHPSIVRVLDCGVERGVPFLIMTYAPRGSLRQLYPEGARLSLIDILSYVNPIASALSYAHGQKLIHRDIKPENILLGVGKEVLLSDFGLAVVSSSSVVPETKAIAGTVAYMAPEQIMGKPRAASDQYALGVVVYEWLCGELPFDGTFLETCTQHLYAPPSSLCERVSGLSPALENVVLKVLAKEPYQRFASVQEFADALGECVRPSVPHHYSTLREPSVPFEMPVRGLSLRRFSALSARGRLFSFVLAGLCLLIVTLVALAPAFLQPVPLKTQPALPTQEPQLQQSLRATPVPSTVIHLTPTVSPTASVGARQSATAASSNVPQLTAEATSASVAKPKQTAATPTAPVVVATPTPIPVLRLQVSPGALSPKVCSESVGNWECTLTLSALGADSGRIRWSMAIAGGMVGVTTNILHGRLEAGESRSLTIYVPNNPFTNNCSNTSFVFTSSVNIVVVPWNCS